MARRSSSAKKIEPAYVPPGTQLELDSLKIGLSPDFALEYPVVYASGDVSLFSKPSIAIAGARIASNAGAQRSFRLANELAKLGVTVLSGLAAGIDYAAHNGAIEGRGRTIAVIGSSLDNVYPPDHARLQEHIYEKHLLVSLTKCGQKTLPKNFPERNRLMARLSLATVIIEASDTSGSLHQAAECIRVGKPVFIAQSILENPKATWPARFVDKPGVHILRTIDDIISHVLERP